MATAAGKAGWSRLSILTVLMMPATLVTGFFGMNIGGLPLRRANMAR